MGFMGFRWCLPWLWHGLDSFREVRRLFQSIDSSGDGAITLQEFEKLVASPKLRFWMSQLELLGVFSLQSACF